MTRFRLHTEGAQKGAGYRLLCAVLASIQILLPTLAAALPTDGHVVGGQAIIQQPNPKTLTIQQATDRAILNWRSFSIAADEAVHFVQPSIRSIALNRVTGIDPSVILGRLQSNGRVFLINPNGIVFGAGAQVNVGGLLATTLQIRDDDFMAGRYLFAQDPLKSLKSVVNQGTIRVSDHGFVVLAAPGVSNEGMIVANLGSAVLASGKTLTVDLMGDGLINYAIGGKVLNQVTGPDGKPLSEAVSNSGIIQADGGQVIMAAKASSDIFSSVVNQSGVIRARSLENHGGIVKLIGGDDGLAVATAAGAMRPAGEVSGAVINVGTIDVSAGAPNASQGSVAMMGERVGQLGTILATGADGANGGEVVIASTTRTVLASGSRIDVGGTGQSSGGRLRVWSDQDTFFDSSATILARGGELGGNGGFIELSGRESLGYAGTVDALAPFGLAGTLLLDPRNITIATAGGAVYNPGSNNLFANTPATDVIIMPASINAAAANVILQANNDITVTNAVAMTNNGVGLTLQAGRDINVNASISTNNGNISLSANDAAAIGANRLAGTGDMVFGAGANLSAGVGSINLSIGSSAAAPFTPGSITTVRNLTTTTGSISINSRNTVSLSGIVNAGSGSVSMNANSDGAGAESFTMNAGSSIATTNTSASAVQIVVNSPTGGTGAASLRGSIAMGNGGTATVSTRGQAAAGGNVTGGAITQGAALTMNSGATGTIAFATGAAASSITLNTVGNDFIGAVGVSRAFNVALRDANALALGVSTISGTLGVTTAGAVTQNGALTVTGTTTLASGVANNITLTNAANDFSTVAITNGSNVALTDTNALVLAASTVSGTLGVTTNGALTQSGILTVTGATTLAVGAANNINLATSANNFSVVSVTSGNIVSLRDTNALILGTSTVGGALALTTGGALTQSGALNVTGATTFTATAANTDILLGTQANNFGGALSVAGTLTNFRDLSLRNVNAGATVPALAGLTALRNLTLTYTNAPVALPALTLAAGGNLTVTAGGAITDSGNLIIPGTTTLTASANNIMLDNANNFTGAVSVTSGNNVALNDINGLVLGPS
ncbi:MAG: filamentous hemagglutinin N-terminal domain-containing protein, partial [Nitrospirae bacterium]|nr:filamentous hemagglutinin N-terminal domain-containing protein [Nitrospirota bacterium]